MSIDLLIAVTWIVAGLICALVVTILEMRSDARKDGHRDPDDMPPAAEGILLGALVPLVAVVLLAIGFYMTLNWMATKLARIDRLPEVRARKLKAADALMDADEEPSA